MSSGTVYAAASSYPFMARVLDDYMTEWRHAEVLSEDGRARSAWRLEHERETPMPLRKPIRTLSSFWPQLAHPGFAFAC
jgi:hypothetical protein